MRPRHEPEVPWGSFADALSGMLFVFVLTTFSFAWQLARAKAIAEEQRQDLEQRTRDILDADERAVELTRAHGALTTCLKADETLDPEPQRGEARVSLYLQGAVEWFQRGEARLRTDLQLAAVRRIRTCITELLRDEDLRGKYRVRVYLEGHTDSEPLAGADTNWELSGRRAAAVVRRVVGDPDPDLDEAPAAPAPDRTVTEALADDRLEVMAVGMADLQPAWTRLCDAPTDAADREVCDALRAWSDARVRGDGDDQPLIAALTAALAGGRDFECAPIGALPATRPELVRLWANRCPDPEGDRGDRRRGTLRRVDLRLELLPRVGPTLAAAAP